MADHSRHVYLTITGFAVGAPAEILPDLGLTSNDGTDLTALGLAVPEGTGQAIHVFVLNEETKARLMEQLSGGSVLIPKPSIVLPSGLGNNGG